MSLDIFFFIQKFLSMFLADATMHSKLWRELWRESAVEWPREPWMYDAALSCTKFRAVKRDRDL